MKQIELNVIESFRLAKNDIIHLQEEVVKLSQTQERLMEHISLLEQKNAILLKKIDATKTNTVTKVIRVQAPKAAKPKAKVIRKVKIIKEKAKKKMTKYVGSTDSKIYHNTSARIAKMIKLKNRVYSDSPAYLEKLGMKPSRELQIERKKGHQKAAKKGMKTKAKGTKAKKPAKAAKKKAAAKKSKKPAKK